MDQKLWRLLEKYFNLTSVGVRANYCWRDGTASRWYMVDKFYLLVNEKLSVW